MRKILKILAIIIAVLIVGLFALKFALSEKMPKGEQGAAADALAQKMLTAINKPAWDSTGVVQWRFHGRGDHDFLWDRTRNWVQVKWDENEVYVVLDSLQGTAFQNGKPMILSGSMLPQKYSTKARKDGSSNWKTAKKPC